ncbi:MAG: SigB/SigF/SigG family RNA polymerase sigma factor [Clostridia bacterium]|nr:SigB/SigF/SigG family RNA polymerase sigma factor [Clostridia bacterium]
MVSKVEISGVNTSVLPRLSAEKSRELLEKIAKGDENARETFITANMRLVLSVVKRFYNKKAAADDVFQAGCVGLIKAIDNFDLSVGVRFSTYAVPMIIGEIKRFLRGGNSLRVARSIRDTAYRALKTRESIEADRMEATITEIARRMNVGEKEVVYALDAISDPVSLFDPVYNKSGDTLLIMDQIGDEKNTEENWTEKVALASAMEMLDSREKNVLYLRYYEGKTQTEISEAVGLSQAQVSRIEKSAIKSIRSYIS